MRTGNFDLRKFITDIMEGGAAISGMVCMRREMKNLHDVLKLTQIDSELRDTKKG